MLRETKRLTASLNNVPSDEAAAVNTVRATSYDGENLNKLLRPESGSRIKGGVGVFKIHLYNSKQL